MKTLQLALTIGLIHLAIVLSAQMDDFVWSDFPDAGNYETEKLTGSKYIYSVFTARDHFYQPEWYDGTITTIHGETHLGLKLRFNAFTGELIAYNERTKGLFEVDRDLVAAFSIVLPNGANQNFRKLTLRGEGSPEYYYEILHEGNISIMSHVRIEVTTTSLFKNEFGLLDNKRFDTLRTHYFISTNGTLMRIYSGRKWLLQHFPDQKREVRRFLRNNNFYDFRTPQLPAILIALDQAGYF